MSQATRDHFRVPAAGRIFAALIIALTVLAALAAWRVLGPAATEAYDAALPVMRLHVVPHDNTPESQTLKLHVRDRVLQAVYELTRGLDAEEAAARLAAEAETVRAAAEDEVRRRGAAHPVRIVPEAGADGRPAALRVVIGAGAGNNWFCVLVPPLCFSDLDAVEKRPVDPERPAGVRFAWRWLDGWLSRLSRSGEGVGQVHEDDVDADLAHAAPRDGHVRAAPE